MTLTPFMILILACYALFIGVVGFVSIWSKGGKSKAAAAASDQSGHAASLLDRAA